MKPALSTRQAQVAEYVAKQVPTKVIAYRTGLDIETVRAHIKAAAAKLPGNYTARGKLTLWFFNVLEDET